MPTQLLSPADLDWYTAEEATDRQIHALIRCTARCERCFEAVDWQLMNRTDFRSACDLLAALCDRYHDLLQHSDALDQRLYTFPGNDQSDDDKGWFVDRSRPASESPRPIAWPSVCGPGGGSGGIEPPSPPRCREGSDSNLK